MRFMKNGLRWRSIWRKGERTEMADYELERRDDVSDVVWELFFGIRFTRQQKERICRRIAENAEKTFDRSY